MLSIFLYIKQKLGVNWISKRNKKKKKKNRKDSPLIGVQLFALTLLTLIILGIISLKNSFIF